MHTTGECLLCVPGGRRRSLLPWAAGDLIAVPTEALADPVAVASTGTLFTVGGAVVHDRSETSSPGGRHEQQLVRIANQIASARRYASNIAMWTFLLATASPIRNNANRPAGLVRRDCGWMLVSAAWSTAPALYEWGTRSK